MNFITICVFISLISGSLCCSCIPANVSQHYESTNLMVQALINGQQIISTGTYGVDYNEFIRFQITVQKVFKASTPEVRTALRSGYMYTSGSSASCGISLTTGQIYIISAGLQELYGLSKGPTDKKLSAYSCGFQRQVESLTTDEIRFFDELNKNRSG